jgi:aryl-alcohol dehydrogenase-like predicted oxidoreductase
MEVERLDLLHFHWWDYDDGRYLDALEGLAEERTRGRIAQLGLTNFDSAHVREIRERGIPVITNQVQYSLIDRRPAALMAPYCVENGVRLLTYGTLCGGLLSETYLGKPEPALRDLNTFSLRKYKPMVDAWGGWALFQELLQALSVIAKRHGASIGNVAVRSILDQPGVAGVIVGARLGLSEHRSSNERVFHLRLDDEDRERIDIVEKRSRDLLPIIGDCGAEYR